MTYGEGRSNGSSKLLPYHRFVRKVVAIPYGVRCTTDSIVCYANSDACPYSGFVREVIAIPHGVGRSNGTHTWVRPYSGFVRKVIAIPHGVRRLNGMSRAPSPTMGDFMR